MSIRRVMTIVFVLLLGVWVWRLLGPDVQPNTRQLKPGFVSQHSKDRANAAKGKVDGTSAFWQAFGSEWADTDSAYADTLNKSFALAEAPVERVRFRWADATKTWILGSPKAFNRSTTFGQMADALEEFDDAIDVMEDALGDTPWTERDLVGLEEWLTDFKRRLPAIESAADADFLHLPLARTVGIRERSYVDVSYSMSIIDAAEDLRRSAMLEMGNRRLDEAWRQLCRLDRLLEHYFEDRPSLISYLIVTARRDHFEIPLARLLASPDLDEELLDRIHTRISQQVQSGRDASMLKQAIEGELVYAKDQFLSVPWVASRIAEISSPMVVTDVPEDNFPEDNPFSIDWRVVLEHFDQVLLDLANATTRLDGERYKTYLASTTKEIEARVERAHQWSGRVVSLWSRKTRSRNLADELLALFVDGSQTAANYRLAAERNRARMLLAVELVQQNRLEGIALKDAWESLDSATRQSAGRCQLEIVRGGFRLSVPDAHALEVASPERSFAAILDGCRERLATLATPGQP
ncbi:MAG: hypothetical protein AAFV88_03885 [Planctomycetota bacterium]